MTHFGPQKQLLIKQIFKLKRFMVSNLMQCTIKWRRFEREKPSNWVIAKCEQWHIRNLDWMVMQKMHSLLGFRLEIQRLKKNFSLMYWNVWRSFMKLGGWFVLLRTEEVRHFKSLLLRHFFLSKYPVRMKKFSQTENLLLRSSKPRSKSSMRKQAGMVMLKIGTTWVIVQWMM